MRQPKQIFSANDNAPIRTRPSPFHQSVPIKPKPSAPSATARAEYKKQSILAWTPPILALILAAFCIFQPPILETLIWPAGIFGLVLAWTAAQAAPDSRLRNISALMLIGAVTVSLAGFLAYNSFSLLGIELVLLSSIVSLVVGWSLRSRPASMLSVFTAVTYLISLSPQLNLFEGLMTQASQIGILVVPVLLVGHFILSHRLKSRTLLLAALLTTYIWFILSARDIPSHALAGIGFAVAAGHYCLGQAWSSRDVFGARVHVIFAALAALVAAFLVQTIWMTSETGQAKPFWPPSDFWWVAFGLAISTLFTACLARYKSSQISLIGIFAISFAALALPLATAKPDLIYLVFDKIPGLAASPGLGLIIGATIIAFGLIWIVKGLKANRHLDIFIGAAAIGVESMILFRPDRLNMDFGVIFVVSLIFALCMGGLIAGSSSSPEIQPRQHA